MKMKNFSKFMGAAKAVLREVHRLYRPTSRNEKSQMSSFMPKGTRKQKTEGRK